MPEQVRVDRTIVDPGVVVPEAVRRAAAAADAALQAATQPPKSDTAPAPKVDPNEFITIAPQNPPQRLPNSVTSLGKEPPEQPQQQPQQEPQPQQRAQEPPAQPQAPQQEPNYKHMYESMHGRYRQTNDALVQANARIEALENMLADLRTMPAAAPAAPAAQPPQRQLVTQKDIDEVGPDLIDLMRRISQEQVATVAPPPSLLNEVQQLRQQVTGTAQQVTQTARQAMHSKLDEEIPDWRTINHDPEFHAWLALPDAYSGVNRKKLLTDAYGQNDAARVLSFFRGFASELAATAPTEPATIEPQPQAPASPSGRRAAPNGPSLAELAAPGRARVAAAPTPPAEKQLITTADINAFYADIRKGAYRGREQLQQQLEAELHQAMREGRVVKNT